ncbi:MAG: acetate--CoA ligase family protein [Myxococcota bacterium]|nr:CoA-binding protein [Deltaproteobacteria bacterium]MCP4244924.1 CoA-binding protein [bacterium]MDP6076492.1 acetate--CoA ligase family protein [Myxococcota bacterium]MDP6243251.1 acetate--CoA ligase family protein [Myxococcota bacterium]MDP7073930.1 acetate--CoA ligase family protein [Myxococcota bacterium]
MQPSRTLSEHASKRLLASYGVPCTREALVSDAEAAVAAAEAIGFPVVVKLCGDTIAHKTERGLVRVGLSEAAAVRSAAEELLSRARPEDGDVGLLVAEMVHGGRELIAGLARDPDFGPCVMLGLGGILAEALGDVVFAVVPIDVAEARRLPHRLAAGHWVTRPFRGEPPVDLEALAEVLVGLSRLAVERPDVASVDLNPLIVRGGLPVAVDALVELGVAASPREPRAVPTDVDVLARFRPLFEPRGVVVAGASAHPGKFGYVSLHNLLRFGYAGEVFPINRDGSEVLGRQALRDVTEVPQGAADLVFICTPNHANVDLLRACAERGIRAAFVASGGYGEAGEEGHVLERELVRVADELGMLLAGPNGQGVISTPRSLCAQIVAPYPPPGPLSVVSQSGNLVSSFLNYAVETGVGVARAVSCGNSAQQGIADFLEFFGADPETRVALAYLEGVGDGARFVEVARRFSARKPLVLVKGGVAVEGQRAAASHTGSLATDDRVFDGVARQLGILRAPSIEEAFEWAATLATQPLPRGRRTVVFTTAGGWGVLAADACVAAGLEVVALPEELRTRIDSMVPSRWSRRNPIDLAGGETRDTIPEALDLVCAHPDVDAVIQLGIGIQSASAQVLKTGSFYPDHGLERIVAFHERQDRRYAAAAREVSERYGKPVLTASELVHTARDYENPGSRGVREEGRLCHPSAHRAVRALKALVDYAEFRRGLDG